MIFISGIRNAHDVFHNSRYSLHTQTFARDDNNSQFGYFVLVLAAVPTKNISLFLIRKEKINPYVSPPEEHHYFLLVIVSEGVGLVFLYTNKPSYCFSRAILLFFFCGQYLNSLSEHSGARKEREKRTARFYSI